jgi:hypothetical protein
MLGATSQSLYIAYVRVAEHRGQAGGAEGFELRITALSPFQAACAVSAIQASPASPRRSSRCRCSVGRVATFCPYEGEISGNLSFSWGACGWYDGLIGRVRLFSRSLQMSGIGHSRHQNGRSKPIFRFLAFPSNFAGIGHLKNLSVVGKTSLQYAKPFHFDLLQAKPVFTVLKRKLRGVRGRFPPSAPKNLPNIFGVFYRRAAEGPSGFLLP